jgi:phage-related protein
VRPGEFYLNGVSSRDFDMYIQHRPTRQTPVRQLTDATASNRSGTRYRDRGTYVNSEIELSLVFLTRPDDTMIDAISEWFDLAEYGDFVPYYDEQYTYKVMVTSSIEFENTRSMVRAVTATVKFSVFPYKYMNNTLNTIHAGQNLMIFNPTKYEAKPKIILKGSGNVSLKINDSQFTFVGMPYPFELDSESLKVSKLNVMQELDFPVLQPGKNTITTTASSFDIIPRLWRRAT